MLSSFVIALREGLEAALIVSILAAYLVKSGRAREVRTMWLGVGLAAALSAAVGLSVALGIASLPEEAQEAVEGVASLLAVGVLTWMVLWMKRNARHIRSHLEQRAGRAVAGGAFAIALLAFSAVAREGLETVLFLYASFRQSATPAASGGGALAGLVISAALGYALYRGGTRLNLRRFFQITGGLVIVVSAGLLATALHALGEAGLALPLSSQAWDTSGFLAAEGFLGSVLKGLVGYRPTPTILEVLAYWAYLAPAMIAFFGIPRRRHETEQVATAAPASERAGAATAG